MADVPINAFHKYPVDPLIQCLMIQVKSKELNGISRVSSEDTYQDVNTDMFLSVTSMSTYSFRSMQHHIYL